MRERVMIFDGVKDQEIGAPYFFQDERIRDLDKNGVVNMYKNTRVRLHVFKELDGQAGDLTEHIHKTERGLNILRQMVKDMCGDDIGELIINKIETSLKKVTQ